MKNLKKILRDLKNLGAVAIKQSLEDEGASFQEVSFSKKISKSIGLKLNVKVGGCEAKNDVHFCHAINVDGIVAPMVESEYALTKFIQTIPASSKTDLYINLETKNAFKNLNQIINSKSFNRLKGVVIGRSDLVSSYNLKKTRVDSRIIFKLLISNLKKIKKKNKLIKMGGSVTQKSGKFISELFNRKLIDRIETRNIEIKLNNSTLEKLNIIIPLIFKYEIEWLKYKNKKFKLDNLSKKINSKRIVEMNSRLIKK